MSFRIAPLLFLFASFLTLQAQAMVDMRNANYSESWIDLQVKGSAYDLRLQRTYNSRTLYSGILGFGWCTEFETTIKVTAENTLRATECGAGFEIDYVPANFTADNLNKNIEKIMDEVKKRNKGRPADYFTNLAKDLRNDSALRDEFAKQLNLNGSIKENSKYIADGRSTDFIIFKGGEYTRNLSNGTMQKFSKAGKLVQMNDRNGNFIKIIYKGDKIASVVDSGGSSLQFKFYENSKFVKSIVGPSGLQATYKYKGENLIEINNAWKNTYKHEYDDLYNMTKAIYPDKTFVALTYDKDKDWVMSYSDRRGCKETYAYVDNEKDPFNNYSSSVEKICNGKVTNKSSYEFWHQTRKDGHRFLAKSKSVVNGKEVETTYHEAFGRPTELLEDGNLTKFDYYPNGQLMKKVEPNTSYSYKYDNTCSKVSEVSVTMAYPTEPPSKNRKPSKVETKKIVTNFLYDTKRCNLQAAKNSSGQTVALSYDVRGRITKIVDQSKKDVTITYEDRFGKPYIVSRPGLGTIKFKYLADGSVDKFDTDDDPLVASQVLNIFSNMLEIIGPATTESNNI